MLYCLGKPSDLYDKCHPDWTPTKAMGHSSTSVASGSKEFAVDRHVRAKKRAEHVRKRSEEEMVQTKICDDKENVDPIAEEHVTSENDNVMNKKSIKIQTVQNNLFPSQTWFKEDDERVRFYTGLPTMAVLIAVLDLIRPGLPERKSLDKFQQLLLTLMRLRLNLCVQDLSYRFGIHSSTVTRVFQSCIDTMFIAMKFLVRWPTREELRLTLPTTFKNKFSSCAVILDCFEIFIERPSCLLARAQTWSSYKHHNTAKYLIGITPQGTVSFISSGWGGRVSDKHITEHCGVLENLLPGDLVLADRGFDIQESCGLFGACLQIPSFTKGKPQLSPFELENTRDIANVRIHVERVIGCVRQKYVILGHGIVPIQSLMSAEKNTPCLLDKITFVCCALTNCCKSVVATR